MNKWTIETLDQPIASKPRAVAVGVFDGLHIGHRAVIAPLVRHADLSVSVLTFTGVQKKQPFSLSTPDIRDHQLETMAVEELFEMPFSLIRDLSPEAFVTDVLHRMLGAKVVRCGFNFRFGHGAVGDVALLRSLCDALDITVEVADAIEVDGAPVSTTRIRQTLECGNVPLANRMLGRPFTIDVEVQSGQRLGRRLGTPTINQPLPDGFVRPRFGVYASTVIIDGVCMHGVTNIGIRPTVGAPGPLAETWIPDYIGGSLYNQKIAVSLTAFLRDEIKFDSLTALKEQITRDEQAARTAVFGEAGDSVQAILFDFDDTLQDSELAFEKAARQLLDRRFPQWDEADRAKWASEMVYRRNGGYFRGRYAGYTGQNWYQLFFADLLADWGIEGDPQSFRDELMRLFPFAGVPFDGVTDLLIELRRRGYKLGIITNGGSASQNLKIDNSGLRPLMDTVVACGDEKVYKPNPEVYRRAAARLGVAIDRCMFVGDYPATDIAGALAAGMRPVLVKTVQHTDNPYEDVPALDYTTDLLRMLSCDPPSPEGGRNRYV